MKNILDAIADRKVFAEHFEGDSWEAWKAFLCALFALPMSEEQLAIYRKHTGRTDPPSQPAKEAWLVCGRRAGKSYVLACVAVFLACFKDWRPYLGPGEHGTIMVVAEDRKQARAIMRFIKGLLHASAMLRRTIVAEAAESVTLKNRVVIETHTSSFRSTRGYTTLAALCDEISVWPSDDLSAEPDAEVINSIRPGMATIPGAMLLCASSPHGQRGALWDAHRQYFGVNADGVLVWQAPTRDMNPSVPQAWIDQQLARDPIRASADYMALFRSDISGFISRETVMACVVPGLRERPPDRATRHHAFVDPSGGSTDSFTLCIAHNDFSRRTVVLDCLREVKPPFSPESVVAEFSALMKAYGLLGCSGDHYAKEWPVESFRRHGIAYSQDAQPKSDLYAGHLLPLLNSRRIELFDLPALIGQICALERIVRHGAGDRIDHPPHGHDDLVNAVAGVGAMCSKAGGYLMDLPNSLFDDDLPAEAPAPASPIPNGWSIEEYERRTRPTSPLPREYLPPGTVEAFARARMDMLRKAHLAPDGGLPFQTVGNVDLSRTRDDGDDGEILPDGATLRVPMMLRDAALSPMQKAIADAATRFDDGGGGRPGSAFDYAAAARVREQAYLDAKAELSSAWRTPPATDGRRRRRHTVTRDPFGHETGTMEEEEMDDAAGQYPGGQREGDACLTDNRQPGHLNARLECVPDRQDARPLTADEGRRLKDQAYAEYCADLRDGWRTRP